MNLRAGERVGAFEIVGPLGAGGMGEVYCARDAKLGRDVALKILPPHLGHEPEYPDLLRAVSQQRLKELEGK